MTGVELHRKMVPLPSDLFGLADTDTQRQLRASFRIVPESDRGLGNDLVDRKKALVGKYLRLIPGHGWVVLRCERPQLDKAVEKLKADVEAFGKMLEGNLQKRMNLQRNQLFEALWPSVRTNPPQRYLDAWWVRSAEERLRHSLKRDLTKAFGSAASLIHAMAVKHQYKDVTYESLQDKQFMAKVRQAVPELTQHHEEGDAALSLQQGADLLPSAA